jgi:hypothetical protein
MFQDMKGYMFLSFIFALFFTRSVLCCLVGTFDIELAEYASALNDLKSSKCIFVRVFIVMVILG